MNARLLLCLLAWPVGARAEPTAIVVASSADAASLALVAHARARIRAETHLVDDDAEDAARKMGERAIATCAGSRSCMKHALGELGGGLALYIRADAQSIAIEQALVSDDGASDVRSEAAGGAQRALAALDRHLDAHVVVPLGTPEAASRARARMGLVPSLAMPTDPAPPLQPRALPQAPMGRGVSNAPPQPLCYGARTDDCTP